MAEKSRGKIIVLSAPSGTGKTTIKNQLMKSDPSITFSVSATTRSQREGESDGKDYYFITEEEFKSHIENDDFIEWHNHFGNYYGTLKIAVEPAMQMGCNILLDVDINGAINVKSHYGDQAILIFINPPSLEVLEERLRGRGTDSEESVSERIKTAGKEMESAEKFDYVIVNDDVNRATGEIIELIRAQ